MLLRRRWWIAVALPVVFASLTLGQDSSPPSAAESASSDAGRDESAAPTSPAAREAPADLVVRPLPRGTSLQRHVVGEGSVAGAGTERLVYSNTKGLYAVAPGAGRLFSDDIAISSTDGCTLRRFRFQVSGKADPAGIGGPFSVTAAFYSSCPNAVSSSNRPSLVVPATQHTFNLPDDSPRILEVVVPSEQAITLYANTWFGVSFSRANAGIVMGAPPLEGHSGDVIDFPGFACNAYLGGFPNQPHASFNLELYGDEATCPVAHVGYKNHNAAGTTFANGGANVFVADDLAFLENGCDMVGYDVAVRGIGTFTFQFQNGCDDASVIPGTVAFFAQTQSTSEPRVRRFTFDPPIHLPRTPWFAVRPHNTTSGIILAGSPMLGDTSAEYCKDDPVLGPTQVVPPSDVYGGFHVAITCAGSAPPGACCDMYVTECVAGSDAGKACRDNADCESPGSCESVCRVLPLANCLFPPRGTTLRPDWQEGQTCDSDPFPNITCGEAACCYKGTNPPSTLDAERCHNLTRNECDAQWPLYRCSGGYRSNQPCASDVDCPGGLCKPAPRQWQPGRFCGVMGQQCPLSPCFWAEGDCWTPHDSPGCTDPDCCTTVCNSISGDWCCEFSWDYGCVYLAMNLCEQFYASNDECASAYVINVPSTTIAFVRTATPRLDQVANSTDPEFCCHNGLPLMCHGGVSDLYVCATDADCPGGTCGARPPKALQTVWYKFVAPEQGSVRARACGSQSPNNDSILQIFSAADASSDQAACATLTPIACSDDKAGCGALGRNSDVCVGGLTPGRLYYLIVGAKSEEFPTSEYVLTLSAGCSPPSSDADSNGRVDLKDFAAIQNCFAGSGNHSTLDCCLLLEEGLRDNDLDLDDFTQFPGGMTGP